MSADNGNQESADFNLRATPLHKALWQPALAKQNRQRGRVRGLGLFEGKLAAERKRRKKK